MHGPLGVEYWGRYAREAGSDGFVVAESYVYQAPTTANATAVGLSFGVGVLPALEVGVAGGLAYGRYTVDIGAETVGGSAAVTRPEEYPNPNVFLGPQLLVAPFPASDVRPVIGANLAWWKGTRIDDHVAPPEETGTFAAPSTWIASVVPGAEARLSNAVDLFLHAPLGVVVAGGEIAARHTGAGGLGPVPDPPSSSAFGFAILVGIQIRLVRRG